MIERRATITLNWRPAGEPARRFDDFAELPRVAANDAPVPAAPEDDRREIGSRLENWARWLTTSTGPRAASSPTAAFCDRLRLEAEGDTSKSPGERRRIDEDDALLIELAMRGLETKHRLLLYWCYIRQAQPEVVCRKMSIAHKPATVFVDQFRQAQAAVQWLLDNERKQA